MRKLIVCDIVSLDGSYEGPGGDVTALPTIPSRPPGRLRSQPSRPQPSLV
ncbi:hypothetical protein QIS99_15495 [Streptomyces sp. B-S-A8]|uniref:Uncharacterized protein n=1 Tax=Streptomyces solicavernae TaxID=3043614 RepID=A0ABT6RTQ6_9ACTN|nr:hypothetical protein [Streptomyces sp. B-S-A8]MDI3387594.1 hypothetical protein [Streptomyces sp. B-S-A8]